VPKGRPIASDLQVLEGFEEDFYLMVCPETNGLPINGAVAWLRFMSFGIKKGSMAFMTTVFRNGRHG